MATDSDIELNARAARYDAVAAIVAGFLDYNIRRGGNGETFKRDDLVELSVDLYARLKATDDRGAVGAAKTARPAG